MRRNNWYQSKRLETSPVTVGRTVGKDTDPKEKLGGLAALLLCSLYKQTDAAV